MLLKVFVLSFACFLCIQETQARIPPHIAKVSGFQSIFLDICREIWQNNLYFELLIKLKESNLKCWLIKDLIVQ